VAVIGAGPAGFYTCEHLLRQTDLTVQTDLYDRLPCPYGLVRLGVAPDHEKIRNVTRVYDKTADRPGFRFFGNVELGNHVTVEDLRRHYHQIVYTTGAQVDRRLGIPGEDLEGSHSATAFVAWYNGHPDYRDYEFDLSASSVVVVGVGNVAVDVARILCRTTEELATTDIADYALEALRHSRVRDVYMLGRRGPSQAAFTNPEIKEMGELPDADIVIHPEEAALDPLSRAEMEATPDRLTTKKVDIIQEFSQRPPDGKRKRLHLRFLVSPVEIFGDDAGRVSSVKIVKNILVEDERGRIRPNHTDQFEEIPAGLVFRSVGYRGVSLPGVPFKESWGVIENQHGRVHDAVSGRPVLGEYAAGWIKRGPSGVIGTNKSDAVETVNCMLEDAARGFVLQPPADTPEEIERLLRTRQPDLITYADWQKIKSIEDARGAEQGRPRVKFTTVAEMVDAARQ
jgi:ferredoxin--NADP+ reductase